MKNQWSAIFTGTTKVKVSGRGIERFLNQLTRSGISIWNVKRHGAEAITFQMGLKDINQLRGPARTSKCKIRFIERAGGPFFLKKLWTNSGFLLGGAAFLAVIIILSNMVWGIEINGASPATEHKIRKELSQLGVEKGKLQFTVEGVDEIQRDLTDNIKALTWVGVELQGTTYHLQVVEKKEPEKPEVLKPQNLVAKKKALVVKMFVEEGEPAVELNEYVRPGQLLVSGTIGKEDETKSVPARGEILGETWYKTHVDLPLNSTFKVFSGKEKRNYYLGTGGKDLKVWGFGKHQFKQSETESNQNPIKIFKWELPLSVKKETIREREVVVRIYSEKQAVQVAKELARRDIKSRLPEDAIIKGEKILHQSIENDKVKLITYFRIIEDIAAGQPITQGDE
ncbi:sporulation protein YqfD [Mesobacillus zeae]|uniref:Sporulation protein YqfD n=1 Tax=Mesobacillus zeae TaxID=1917180 RepID=A0A398B349_9BACI|nr:sporulation protein YqfD [Mesobacillus zeae]RID83804.1 sporulation protein YqfD [Mesobacillus zeae]